MWVSSWGECKQQRQERQRQPATNWHLAVTRPEEMTFAKTKSRPRPRGKSGGLHKQDLVSGIKSARITGTNNKPGNLVVVVVIATWLETRERGGDEVSSIAVTVSRDLLLPTTINNDDRTVVDTISLPFLPLILLFHSRGD
jgi:hypothetical protein